MQDAVQTLVDNGIDVKKSSKSHINSNDGNPMKNFDYDKFVEFMNSLRDNTMTVGHEFLDNHPFYHAHCPPSALDMIDMIDEDEYEVDVNPVYISIENMLDKLRRM
jgi:hypothetical protein